MLFLLLLLILLSNGVFGSTNRLQNNLVTTFQRYKFEGIDVTEMPKEFSDWQNDCYGYYLRCIRHTPLMWVCGFNLKSWKFGAYPNECIIELINCQQRVKNKKPVFGEWIYGKLNLGEVFYNGENKDCEAYTRRSQDIEHMVHMYFARNEELKQLVLRRINGSLRKAPPAYFIRTFVEDSQSSNNTNNRMENLDQNVNFPNNMFRLGRNVQRVAKSSNSFTHKPDLFDQSVMFLSRNN